jgi:hypothetical protein
VIEKKRVKRHAGIKPALKTPNAAVMFYKHSYDIELQYK